MEPMVLLGPGVRMGREKVRSRCMNLSACDACASALKTRYEQGTGLCLHCLNKMRHYEGFPDIEGLFGEAISMSREQSASSDQPDLATSEKSLPEQPSEPSEEKSTRTSLQCGAHGSKMLSIAANKILACANGGKDFTEQEAFAVTAMKKEMFYIGPHLEVDWTNENHRSEFANRTFLIGIMTGRCPLCGTPMGSDAIPLCTCVTMDVASGSTVISQRWIDSSNLCAPAGTSMFSRMPTVRRRTERYSGSGTSEEESESPASPSICSSASAPVSWLGGMSDESPEQ